MPTRTLKGRLGMSAFERTQRFCKSDLQSLGHRFSLNALYFNRHTAWEPKQIAAYHQHPVGNRVFPHLDLYKLSTGYRDLGLPKLNLSAEATTLLLAKLPLQLTIATDVATF
jgi:hypothetical protein